ncbi:MAG TPA: sugar phosphate nucleotidyltransferase [Bryobacteraceae bacterium]|nr:sugar phosphate nucleotidyltransferase [Bryobacteraceae bacterium]
MNQQVAQSDAWAVLLAGGDGTRVRSLTARIEGDTRPKQFCRLLGDESLLTQTRRRLNPLFDPNRMLTVVTKQHERFYARELGDQPKAAIIAQPEDRGTGVAIARAMLTIHLERDSDAIVAVFPCDHHYADEPALLKVLEYGISAVKANPNQIVLVGAEPTYPEPDYEWIEPAQVATDRSGLAAVPLVRLWDKANLATAQELMRRGCIWNTFVSIGRVSTFIEALCEGVPSTMLILTAGIRAGDLAASYRLSPRVHFCRNVLAAQPERVLIIRDAMSGWTDLGTPGRILEALSRQNIAPTWLDSTPNVTMPAAGHAL